jgi:hypothetical protein
MGSAVASIMFIGGKPKFAQLFLPRSLVVIGVNGSIKIRIWTYH